MYMRNACKKIMVLALVFAGLVTFAHRAQAQTTSTLIQFTNIWKYDASGNNLGTAWRTNSPAYNDSAWASGPGLLASEDGMAPYLVHVPSGIGTPLPISGSSHDLLFPHNFQSSHQPDHCRIGFGCDQSGGRWLRHLAERKVGRRRAYARDV